MLSLLQFAVLSLRLSRERKAEKADDKAAAEQKDQPKKKAARKDEAE